MDFLRKSKTIKLVWFILAVHILNSSIDPPDIMPDSVPENLNINEIESIAELVAEDILNMENALPEHDEHDSEDGTSLDSKKVCTYSEQRLTKLSLSGHYPVLISSFIYKDELYIFKKSSEISQPPELV